MTNEKPKISSGGFLSVDREQAIRENWESIQNMKRPATVADYQSALDRANAEIRRLHRESEDRAEVVCERDMLNAECASLEAENERLTAENAVLRETLERIDRNIDYRTTWIPRLCKTALAQPNPRAEAMLEVIEAARALKSAMSSSLIESAIRRICVAVTKLDRGEK